MGDLTITCPKCNEEFELTETLAGPAIAEFRKQVQEEARAKEKDLADRETKLANQAAALSRQQASIEAEVQKMLSVERAALTESAKVAAKADVDLQLKSLQKDLDEATDRRKKAEQAELDIRQTAKALQEEKEAWDLEKVRILATERDEVKAKIEKQVEEQFELRLKEKEKTISDMEAKLREAQKKATQGSQQLQGEVLELSFEESLKQRFPWDDIEEVKKGQRGADIVHRVCSAPGVVAGTILWEAKRADNWSPEWARKAKQDARKISADTAIIVSTVLPKGLDHFGEVEGVWVVEHRMALLLASVIRANLIELASARNANLGALTKAEAMYAYMTSPRFRAQLNGIAEPFFQMQSDLATEKNATTRRWKQREKQIDRVLECVSSLIGEVQAIGGSDLSALPFSDDVLEEEETCGDEE